jgi:serpin B
MSFPDPHTSAPCTRPSRRRPLLARAAAAVASLVALSGCFGVSSTALTISGDAPRAAPEREFANGAVAATNAFGIDLYRTTAATPGNVVHAPYAVMTSLAMARAGSAETTRAQFDQALHADRTPNLDGGLNAVDAAVRARTGERQSATRKGRIELEEATSLWGQRGLHVKDDFLNVLSADYGEGFRVVDFHSDSDGSRDAINAWSDDTTHGLITELVPRGGTSPYTRFLAAAATGLRAPWLAPFEPGKTRPDQFRREGEPPVEVPMMEVTSDLLRTATGDGWQAVELPYLGDELALDLILPTGSLADLEAHLSPELLTTVFTGLDQAPRTALDVRVPRFGFTSSTDLRDPLGRLGVTAAFDRTADFSRVTNDEVISLSKVPYEGVFGAEEDGTNPRPDTASVRNEAPPLITAQRVVVDHPFLFVVRDRPTGLALFLGRVVNPV